jgi:hypothetical protein
MPLLAAMRHSVPQTVSIGLSQPTKDSHETSYAAPNMNLTRANTESCVGSYGESLLGISSTAGVVCETNEFQGDLLSVTAAVFWTCLAVVVNNMPDHVGDLRCERRLGGFLRGWFAVAYKLANEQDRNVVPRCELLKRLLHLPHSGLCGRAAECRP